MKTKAIIISLFFCLFMGASFLCGATPYLSAGQPADSVLWKQQLDMIKKNTAEYHLGYVLTGYKYIGKISTEEELERAKLAILDGTGYPAVHRQRKGRKYEERCKEDFGSIVAVAAWIGRGGIRVDMRWHYLQDCLCSLRHTRNPLRKCFYQLLSAWC